MARRSEGYIGSMRHGFEARDCGLGWRHRLGLGIRSGRQLELRNRVDDQVLNPTVSNIFQARRAPGKIRYIGPPLKDPLAHEIPAHPPHASHVIRGDLAVADEPIPVDPATRVDSSP